MPKKPDSKNVPKSAKFKEAYSHDRSRKLTPKQHKLFEARGLAHDEKLEREGGETYWKRKPAKKLTPTEREYLKRAGDK